MVDSESSTAIQDINEFDKYMRILKYKSAWETDPVGFIVNNASSDPKVTIIDKNENPFEADITFFYNHELFQWPKVLLSEAGVETAGDKYNGSDLTLTGPLDVMARIPNGQYYYRYESDADTQIYKYAPFDSNHRGFDFYPHCYAGGGTKRDHFYIGTYKAGLKDDAGTLKFNSWSGVQPWTGGQMRSVPFVAGNVEFVVGETITGTTSGAKGTVVSWHKSSGDWTATPGTAVGIVYIRNQGVNVPTATVFNNNETLTRVSGTATTSGASTVMTLTIADALTYAANKGAGWAISDIWSRSWVNGLIYTMIGTRNAKTVGNGVINLLSGEGYNGLLNGANNIDTNVDEHGTGNGNNTGTSGLNPVGINNLQDLWGGTAEYVAGINFYSNGSCRVTNRDGTGVLAGILPEGSYELCPDTCPTSDGFLTTVQHNLPGAIAFLPATAGVGGSSSSTNFTDYFWRSTHDPALGVYGGSWRLGTRCGPNHIDATYSSTNTFREIGARLKYIPQS